MYTYVYLCIPMYTYVYLCIGMSISSTFIFTNARIRFKYSLLAHELAFNSLSLDFIHYFDAVVGGAFLSRKKTDQNSLTQKRFLLCFRVGPQCWGFNQGDQIGRICVIVYFGQFFWKFKNESSNFDFFSLIECIKLDKKWFGINFGRFFSQTQLRSPCGFNVVENRIFRRGFKICRK
jgi:hypothetical protein